jgi:hypothetical protein
VLHCPIQPSHSRLPYLVHRSASHDLSRNRVDQATKCTHHSAPPHVIQQCARLLRGRPWPLVLLSLDVCNSISGSYMALPVLRPTDPIWVWWSVALRYRYPVVGLAYRDDRCTASTGSVTCRAGRRWAELVSENQWNSSYPGMFSCRFRTGNVACRAYSISCIHHRPCISVIYAA